MNTHIPQYPRVPTRVQGEHGYHIIRTHGYLLTSLVAIHSAFCNLPSNMHMIFYFFAWLLIIDL